MENFDSFHDSRLCGATSKARHTPEAVDWSNSRCPASDGVDQCVTDLGIDSNVAVNSFVIFASSTVRGRRELVSSSSPSHRASTSLFRHRPYPRSRKLERLRYFRIRSFIGIRQHDLRMHRQADRAALLYRRAQSSSLVSSTSLSTITAARGPRVAMPNSFNWRPIGDSGH